MKRAKRNFKYKSSSRTFLSSFDLGLKSSTPKNCGGWKESSLYVRWVNAHIADIEYDPFFWVQIVAMSTFESDKLLGNFRRSKKWASFFSQMQLPELFSDVEDLLNRTTSLHHIINVLVNQIKMSSSIGILRHWIDTKNSESLSHPLVSWAIELILKHWVTESIHWYLEPLNWY